MSTGDYAKQGSGFGGWIGGIFGVMVGAALIWVPRFGPLLVAGPLAAMIFGGIEGAAVGVAGGGALGALIGWGVSRDHILKYEDHLEGGRYLVSSRQPGRCRHREGGPQPRAPSRARRP